MLHFYVARQLLFQQVMTVTLRERRRLTTAPRSMLALCRRRRGSNLIYSRWRKKTSKCRHLFNKMGNRKLEMSLPVSTCVAQFNSMQTATCLLCLAQMREKGRGRELHEEGFRRDCVKRDPVRGMRKMCVTWHGLQCTKNKCYRKKLFCEKKMNQTNKIERNQTEPKLICPLSLASIMFVSVLCKWLEVIWSEQYMGVYLFLSLPLF